MISRDDKTSGKYGFKTNEHYIIASNNNKDKNISNKENRLLLANLKSNERNNIGL